MSIKYCIYLQYAVQAHPHRRRAAGPGSARFDQGARHGHGDAPLRDKFQLVAELGFQGVELDSPSDIPADRILEAKEASGLAVSGVVDSVHWRSTLGDPDDVVRAEGRAALETALRDCKLLGGTSVLLLFQRGATLETVHLPGGTIPPHDGHGPLHIAFAIAADELPAWTERLAANKVAIEGETNWPRGGRSIYFRDPDGHLLELATSGLWATY